MAELDFEHYKQQMRDYLKSLSPNAPASDINIVELTKNMQATFPKKPEQSDRLAMCYAYWHRSKLPMEPEYEKDWRKQIKSYINAAPDNGQGNDNNLYFLMLHLERTTAAGSKKETFDYVEKAIKKMAPQNQKHHQTVELLGRVARPYYDELVDTAIHMHDTGNNYQQRIKAFDKAATVLMKIPHTVRYQKSLELLRAMQPVYMECEWGQMEFGRKCRSIRHRVYESMPPDVQLAMRNAKNKRDWYYK